MYSSLCFDFFCMHLVERKLTRKTKYSTCSQVYTTYTNAIYRLKVLKYLSWQFRLRYYEGVDLCLHPGGECETGFVCLWLIVSASNGFWFFFLTGIKHYYLLFPLASSVWNAYAHVSCVYESMCTHKQAETLTKTDF